MFLVYLHPYPGGLWPRNCFGVLLWVSSLRLHGLCVPVALVAAPLEDVGRLGNHGHLIYVSHAQNHLATMVAERQAHFQIAKRKDWWFLQ